MRTRRVDLSSRITHATTDSSEVDFPVSMRPIQYSDDRGLHSIPGRAAVVRDDTGDPLGIVSDRYALVPHRQLLRSVDDVIEGLDVGSVPRGVYLDRGGARMRALFKFPSLARPVLAGDEICPCIKIENTYDASSRVTIHLGAFRFVCTNLAVGGGGVFAGGFMAVHTGDIPVDEAAKSLGQYLSRFDSIASTYRKWQDEAMQWDHLVNVMDAYPKRAAQQILKSLPEGRLTNVFRAYNAATWHATHNMRSAGAAFDLLNLTNKIFQTYFPPP